MRAALAAAIRARVKACLSWFRLDNIAQWNALSPDQFAVYATDLVQWWLIAKGLEFQEAAGEALETIRKLLHQLVRGVLFRDGEEYVVWGAIGPSQGPDHDVPARRDFVQSFTRELDERSPETGLLLVRALSVPAAQAAERDYDSLRNGLNGLLEALGGLAGDARSARINGVDVFTSARADWPERCAAWSPAFVSTAFPTAWLDADQRRAWRA
jgi:hypothetical protein